MKEKKRAVISNEIKVVAAMVLVSGMKPASSFRFLFSKREFEGTAPGLSAENDSSHSNH